MPKYSTAFGMDVHLRSTTVCALDADTGEAVTRRFPGNPWGEIAGWMDGFPGPSLAAYESGYLGFAPQRELAGLGVECVVAAVSKIPRSAADSASKNDRNDAARMAKAILAHDISPVWIPSPEVEGIRDLAGAYGGATARLATAKQRLLAFLARRGFAYGGTTPAGNPRKLPICSAQLRAKLFIQLLTNFLSITPALPKWLWNVPCVLLKWARMLSFLWTPSQGLPVPIT